MQRATLRWFVQWLALTFYVFMGFMTYGYHRNANKSEPTTQAFAFPAAVLWPIYWGGLLSIEATAWADPSRQKSGRAEHE